MFANFYRRKTMNYRFAKFTTFVVSLWLVAVLVVACQPIQPETVEAQTESQSVSIESLPTESMVIDGAGPITASDPVQAQAEAEFRAAAIAKEEAFYAGDAAGVLAFYADDVLSVYPEVPEVVGKEGVAEGLIPFLENNRVVGTLTIKEFWVNGNYATRYAEWEEVVTAKDGGAAEHHIGRCILNWEKIDGEWKVVSEFINYLDPPTELAVSTE
jgi:ketosteroid isomerase-like protein